MELLNKIPLIADLVRFIQFMLGLLRVGKKIIFSFRRPKGELV